MRAWLLAALLGCLSLPFAGTGTARAEEGASSAAVIPLQGSRDIPAALSARFESLLHKELARVGFSLIDPRIMDIKLAEHTELLSGCQQDSCLLAYARLLGVERLILPRLALLPQDGLGIALTLFEYVPETGAKKEAVSRVAQAVDQCQGCRGPRLAQAVAQAAEQLRSQSQRALAGQVEVVVPREARITIDGSEMGRGPIITTLPPGPHTLVATTPWGRAEKRIHIGPREQRRVELLVMGGASSRSSPTRPLRVVKWVFAGVGLAALLLGTTLWALDGLGSCDKVVGQLQCPELLNTSTLGIVLFTGGAAAIAASTVMIGVDYMKTRETGYAGLGMALGLGGRF